MNIKPVSPKVNEKDKGLLEVVPPPVLLLKFTFFLILFKLKNVLIVCCPVYLLALL